MSPPIYPLPRGPTALLELCRAFCWIRICAHGVACYIMERLWQQKTIKITKHTRIPELGPISICGFLLYFYQMLLFGLDSDRFCAPECIIEKCNSSIVWLFIFRRKTMLNICFGNVNKAYTDAYGCILDAYGCISRFAAAQGAWRPGKLAHISTAAGQKIQQNAAYWNILGSQENVRHFACRLQTACQISGQWSVSLCSEIFSRQTHTAKDAQWNFQSIGVWVCPLNISLQTFLSVWKCSSCKCRLQTA